MTDLSRTIEVVFQGVDDITGTVDKVLGGFDDFSGGIREAVGPLSDLAKYILAVEAALGAAGIALGVVATQAAGQFNQSFAEIATLTGKNTTSLADFRAQLLDYGEGASFAFDAITGATYSAISAGVAYSDSVEYVTSAERLAIAAKADLNETVVLLAGTMNAYGADVSEAGRYSDVFFQVVRDGQTTLPALAQSMSQVTGVAAAAGVPIEVLGAAIADLTAKGAPTSQAITGIKAALSNVIKPTSDAAAVAKELGIDFSVTGLQANGLAGFMEMLYNATGGNIETMSQLFGSTEALNAVMALSANGAETFGNKLANMENVAGNVNTAFETMSNNFSLVNQRLTNQINAFLIEVGTPLEGMWRDVASAMGGLVNAASDAIADGAFDDLYNYTADVAQRIVAVISQIAANLPAALEAADFTGFLTALSSVGDAIVGLFDFDLTSADGLERAIQLVIDVSTQLLNVTAGIIKGFGPLADTLESAVEWFLSLSDAQAHLVGEGLGVSVTIDMLMGLFQGVTNALQGVTGAIQALALVQVGTAFTNLTGPLTNIGALAATAATSLLQIGAVAGAGTAGWAVGTAILEGINAMIPGADTLGTKIYDLLHPGQDAWLNDFLTDTAEELGVVGAALKDTEAASRDTQRELGLTADELDALGEGASYSAVEAGRLLTVQGDLSGALVTINQSLGLNKDGLRNTKEATAEVKDATYAYVEVIRDANGTIVEYRQKNRASTTELESVKKATEDAAKATLEYQVRLIELASDERIKTIEAGVDLNVAQMEADAARMVAALDSIGVAVQSSGDLLGKMIEAFASADRWEQLLIEKEMEKESERRDAAMEMQNKLIQAQIDEIRAREKMMRDGNEIKIDAQGLVPELRLIALKIFEMVRIESTQSQLEFMNACSGIGAGAGGDA